MSSLDYYKDAFKRVGWFIPPYVSVGFLSSLAKTINDNGNSFDQKELENFLVLIYSPDNLAAMVTERYPITPYIKDYKIIIAEAVEAHFMNLDHIAVAGLMPVIEGAGRKLAESRSISVKGIKGVFSGLADHCKKDVVQNKIGAVDEVVSMLDSFIEFTDNHLYIESSSYPLNDKTNRHGILHGFYSDGDYGKPINFYKSIATVDFLCFVSAIRASISWFAPSLTLLSNSLADYYSVCTAIAGRKPTLEQK